jgi:predicted amidophosphoribosyltransferase
MAAYEGPVRATVLAYKEDGAHGLHRALGDAIAAGIRAAIPDGELPVRIVPVPATREARRRRGEDVVRRLARRAVRTLRADGADALVVPALDSVRRVADSAGLGAVERATNLAGAFAVRRSAIPHLHAAQVVLVDDVITTGTTLAECASALRRVDIHPRACATVAATARHSDVGR